MRHESQTKRSVMSLPDKPHFLQKLLEVSIYFHIHVHVWTLINYGKRLMGDEGVQVCYQIEFDIYYSKHPITENIDFKSRVQQLGVFYFICKSPVCHGCTETITYFSAVWVWMYKWKDSFLCGFWKHLIYYTALCERIGICLAECEKFVIFAVGRQNQCAERTGHELPPVSAQGSRTGSGIPGYLMPG